MNNNQQPCSDLLSRLDSVDPVASEPLPAGWSRRNWVQREAVALGDIEYTPASLHPITD